MSQRTTIDVDAFVADPEAFKQWFIETNMQFCDGASRLQYICRVCFPAYSVTFTYETGGFLPFSDPDRQEAVGLVPAREDIAAAPLDRYADGAADPTTIDPHDRYGDDPFPTVVLDRHVEAGDREAWIRDQILAGNGVDVHLKENQLHSVDSVDTVYLPAWTARLDYGNQQKFCWYGTRVGPSFQPHQHAEEAEWVTQFFLEYDGGLEDSGATFVPPAEDAGEPGASGANGNDEGQTHDDVRVPDAVRELNPQAIVEPSPERTFEDVGGMSDLKDLLRSKVVDPLASPERYEDYDLGVTNGVLLHGPPGCGKSHVAGALAGELGRTFLSVTPSDLMSKMMGEPSIRVADLFALARANQPCVVFIDEIDGVTQARGDGISNQSEVQMVNQLLTELQDLADHDVVVVGATNRIGEVDEAIRRSGRFDERIEVPPPDADAREAILSVHLADPPTEPDLDLSPIVTDTAGYAASDLERVVEEAARRAMADQRAIEQADLAAVVEATETSIQEWVGRYDFLAEETNATGTVVQPDAAEYLRARQIVDRDVHRTFADVGGMTDLLETLRQKVLDPLANPQKYEDYGLEPTNGVLLYGPPGCGKTYVSRALAGELDQYFVSVGPADLTSKYSGKPAQLVADVFAVARANQPCILFLDEIDAIAGHRRGPGASGSSETVNQLLTELEAIDDENVVVVGATNLVEDVDGAIRRSGRFDERIEVPPPDATARAAILEVHLADRPLADGIDWDRLADATAGYAASDLELVADEAAHRALRAEEAVTTDRLLAAVERTDSSLQEWAEADRYLDSDHDTNLRYVG